MTDRRTWGVGTCPREPKEQRTHVHSHRIFAADTGTIEDEHALRFNPQAWEKYLKAQRPSQNIEDRRKFDPTKVLMDTSLQQLEE